MDFYNADSLEGVHDTVHILLVSASISSFDNRLPR